jgi:phosphohistidine phosphatase
MPRYLYLLRHAESSEKLPGEPDKERELTSRGIRETILIGAYLYKENTSFDTVLCSVAERAKATANLMADAMKFEIEKIVLEDALYEASTRTLFEFISQINDDHQNVLCVAHNPAISYLAESLTKAEIGDMPPCGLAIIKFNINSWKEVSQGSGELENYIYPGMLSE